MKNSNKNIFEAFFKSTAYAIFSLSLFTTHAIAANITVLCSTALLEPLSALIPEFELATGHKVAIAFKTTKGIVEQVRGGDGADIIIVGRDAAVDLEKTGKLLAGSRLDIGSTSIGLAVRTGAPIPDISSVDAFKKTLLGAQTIAVSKSGLSGAHFMRVVERLGITDEIRPKIKFLQGDGRTADFLAKGEAELAVQFLSELMGVQGSEVVGPFPSGIDNTIVLTSGIYAEAKEPAVASELILFLRSNAIKPKMKKTGIDPL